MSRYCGIDCPDGHHDIAIVDQDGTLVSKKQITDDAAGFTALTQLLTDAGDTAENPIPVAIETPRGLMVARSAPPAEPSSRSPDGRRRLPRTPHHGPVEIRSRRRDDPGRHPACRRPHAPAGPGTHRTHPRHRHAGPGSARRRLATHQGQQRTALTAARIPPDVPGRLRRTGAQTSPNPRSALAWPSRRPQPSQRNSPGPASPPRCAGLAANAASKTWPTTSLPNCAVLACASPTWSRRLWAVRPPPARHPRRRLHRRRRLEQAAAEEFREHPDHAIITSFPGLADLTGARVLAEIGDDRTRSPTPGAVHRCPRLPLSESFGCRRIIPAPAAPARRTARGCCAVPHSGVLGRDRHACAGFGGSRPSTWMW